jgi:ABC-type branched-subunit amino acid transport system permease subunit
MDVEKRSTPGQLVCQRAIDPFPGRFVYVVLGVLIVALALFLPRGLLGRFWRRPA